MSHGARHGSLRGYVGYRLNTAAAKRQTESVAKAVVLIARLLSRHAGLTRHARTADHRKSPYSYANGAVKFQAAGHTKSKPTCFGNGIVAPLRGQTQQS